MSKTKRTIKLLLVSATILWTVVFTKMTVEPEVDNEQFYRGLYTSCLLFTGEPFECMDAINKTREDRLHERPVPGWDIPLQIRETNEA